MSIEAIELVKSRYDRHMFDDEAFINDCYPPQLHDDPAMSWWLEDNLPTQMGDSQGLC